MTDHPMRHLINLVEAAKRPAKASDEWELVHYDGPNHISTKVLNRTVIRASGKDELREKLRAWMEQIGLDPDDEDDLSTVNWRAKTAR